MIENEKNDYQPLYELKCPYGTKSYDSYKGLRS